MKNTRNSFFNQLFHKIYKKIYCPEKVSKEEEPDEKMTNQ